MSDVTTRQNRSAAGRARPAGAKRPAGARQPASAKQPAGSARPAHAKQPAGSMRPAGPKQPATSPGSPPAALRCAAAAQAAEAAGLFVAGVFAAVATADGRSYRLANGIALTVIAFGVAVMLAAVAAGLARARPWSRVPAAMTQLFVVIAGIMLLDGHRLEWGVPALVLAGVCVAGLLTPASLRALNRPASRTPAERAAAELSHSRRNGQYRTK